MIYILNIFNIQNIFNQYAYKPNYTRLTTYPCIIIMHHVDSKVIYYLNLSNTPLPQAGCDTMPILKQSTAGLNLEFSFSSSGCLTKTKGFSQSNNLLIAWGSERVGRDGFMIFPRVVGRRELQPHPGFELWSPISFPTMTTVTLSVPLIRIRYNAQLNEGHQTCTYKQSKNSSGFHDQRHTTPNLLFLCNKGRAATNFGSWQVGSIFFCCCCSVLSEERYMVGVDEKILYSNSKMKVDVLRSFSSAVAQEEKFKEPNKNRTLKPNYSASWAC